MDSKNLFLAFLGVFLTSCASSSYYQVYKTMPVDKSMSKSKDIVYEDDHCKVTYDLWSLGGDMGFVFYNKTDKNIYVNLEESFFILNGIAYNYYQNRVFTNMKSSVATSYRGSMTTNSISVLNYLDQIQTNSSSASYSIGKTASSGISISYNEEKIISIPSKSSKIVSEYSINKSVYRDCDLLRFPKKYKSKTFSKADSPFIFSNRIAYSLEPAKDLIKFENQFYVTEITNYREKEFIEFRPDEFCGQKSGARVRYFRHNAPDKFYIHYSSRVADVFKH